MKKLIALFGCAVLLAPHITRASSQFNVKFDAGAIVSLKRAGDRVNTEYLARRMGDIAIKYRSPDGAWRTVQTATLAADGRGRFTTGDDGTTYSASYAVVKNSTNNPFTDLHIDISYAVNERDLLWTVRLHNDTGEPLEIGDLSIPITVGAAGRRGGGATNRPAGPVILKHSFVSGNDSFMYWMRSDLVGPYLMFTTGKGTGLEYWEAGFAGFNAYVHSSVAGGMAAASGTKWRQTNSSLTLAPSSDPGDEKTYVFKFQWADDYDAVRQNLVDDGKIDIHVVPGMTIPTDLFAEFSLRTTNKIAAVEAEFPKLTNIKFIGTNGDNRLYQVKFSKLGENVINVRYGTNQHTTLEFFVTEPLETLINKRAAFIAHSQHRDPAKWYNGLISDRNLRTGVLLGPDNYDDIKGWRIYEVTCDDPGLCKPAFLAAKNAEFPVQSEVEAMDYYLQHFVWGGLQRTTDETYSYGIYGIPDWHQNRESTNTGRNGQLHIWRVYDYPHVIVMYWGMYQVAKYHPEIKTALTAAEYLDRAFGTANAMFTVPLAVEKWAADDTGFYNELVIPDIINELDAVGRKADADKLRGYWEQKVRYFVNDKANLFQSEYAFDTTGFESTEALARYAVLHADQPGAAHKVGVTAAEARKFMEHQLDANIFCRGTLEPAYYLLGSDIRGGGGNSYTLTYMSQMGGWGVLDYGLNFASNKANYLRIGYASYLSSWALVNSGTPESNYGYWFPGKAADGGAGGGFEPAPSGQTWLGQAHHRGSWYYASEIDLGFCGALRSAATILADDPIFGRFCFGGDWHKSMTSLEVIPKDGLRQRFHAILDTGRVHLILDNDHFVATKPISLNQDLSKLGFSLESDNPAAHTANLHLSASVPGHYTIRDGRTAVATVDLSGEQETLVSLPMSGKPHSFTITRK